MSANGSFDFLRREWVVGTAFKVDRTYFGEQFASGEGVALDWIDISICQYFGFSATYIGR